MNFVTVRMRICLALWFTVISRVVRGSAENFENEGATGWNQTFFISEIFDKYGNNNIMTYEGFEHLLENLGLGKLKFETKHDVSIHKINGTFREFHDALALHKHNHNGGTLKVTDKDDRDRSRRSVNSQDRLAENLRRKCLTAQDILTTYGLKPYHEVVISPSKYLQMCPAIVYELDYKLCQVEETEGTKPKQEERRLVWIYASVSVLLMSLSGVLCVLFVPLIRTDQSSSVLQFLVSLAVGTLCGDSLIHLLPQVFYVDAKLGLEAIAVSKGTVALLAICFFFTVENILKGVRRKEQSNADDSKELNAMIPVKSNHGHGHGHGHGTDGIRTVAWMAIMGDILHNVTDGLSIGAAFDVSLSSGFASSIAIFCHELPHELGDYAILLASGMSIKKSLFYNVLSSVFSFFGMTAGVFLGEFENAASWINAFTAGSFLYIGLSDLVPELKVMQKSECKGFIVQAMGLACGGILMFIIALYEEQIESLLA